MNNIWSGIVTIILAIIGVAIVAVIVSNNANTSNVLNAGGNALSNTLKAAEMPVSGSGLSMPNFNSSSFGAMGGG